MGKHDEPAFPVSISSPEGHQDGPNTWQFPGLSIRDYFAAKAMAALLANNLIYNEITNKKARVGYSPARAISESAYEMSDIMILERNKVQ